MLNGIIIIMLSSLCDVICTASYMAGKQTVPTPPTLRPLLSLQLRRNQMLVDSVGLKNALLVIVPFADTSVGHLNSQKEHNNFYHIFNKSILCLVASNDCLNF